MMRPATLAMALGALSLALIVGVLGFQYLGGIPPCEMCHWQRWPHIAAAVVGLGGGLLIRAGLIEESLGRTLAWLTVVLIAASGALGVYHAGVEWHWWPGPQACTGSAFPAISSGSVGTFGWAADTQGLKGCIGAEAGAGVWADMSVCEAMQAITKQQRRNIESTPPTGDEGSLKEGYYVLNHFAVAFNASMRENSWRARSGRWTLL